MTKVNPESTVAAVERDYYVLQSMCDNLKYYQEVIDAAISKNINALRFLPRVTEDKDQMLKLVSLYGPALKWASTELRGDSDVVLEAVRKSGIALFWATEELQDDKVVVLTAIRQNAHALEFASAAMQSNERVVLEALKFDKLASEGLRNDKDVALRASREGRSGVIDWVSYDLLSENLEVMIAALSYGRSFVDEEEIAPKLEASAVASNCDIISLAAKYGLRWRLGLKEIVEGNRDQCEEFDERSGLCPFMLSAASPFSDLETIFHLAKHAPANVRDYHDDVGTPPPGKKARRF